MPNLKNVARFAAMLACFLAFTSGRSSAAQETPEADASKAVAPMCADGRCDGPLDLNVWDGAWTGGTQALISDANLPVGIWDPGITPNDNSVSDTAFCSPRPAPHASQAHHSIVPAGNDPEIPTLRTVAPTPASNPASLRLGNRCDDYGGERVSKTFTVQPGQTTLQFWYATVFQNPDDHTPPVQPGFGAYLFNGSTPVSNRIDLDPITPGKQSFIVADKNNPFFGVKPGPTVVVYRDWTCVTVDLSGLEGQTLTLVLANRDCGRGAHWGYTYVDSFCLGCREDSAGNASFSRPGRSAPGARSASTTTCPGCPTAPPAQPT